MICLSVIQRGLAGNRLEVKDLFVLGILKQAPLCSPQESDVWTGHRAMNLSVGSHTVESLPDFSCAILVRLING